MTKAKKYKGVHFQFKGSHLAYTEESQGFAASGENDPVLLKAQEEINTMSENQKKILKDIGEEFTPLDKSSVVKNTPSSSEEIGEDNKETKKGTDNTMSDDIVKSLQKKVVSLEVEKALNGYSLTGETVSAISAKLSELELEKAEGIVSAISTAMEEVISKSAKEVEAVKVELGEALEKSNSEDKPDNDLTKALEDEKGHSEEGDLKKGEQTLLEKAQSHLDKIEKGDK
tara:strand:- start:2901 stop:3587 length:687 start_codon:yes stop_codon:yes gene_type:complete